MNIRLGFAEIGEYIGAHYGKRVSLARRSDKELVASFAKRVLIADLKVIVNLG